MAAKRPPYAEVVRQVSCAYPGEAWKTRVEKEMKPEQIWAVWARLNREEPFRLPPTRTIRNIEIYIPS